MHGFSRKKILLFWLVILVIPLATVELGFRIYYAHELGSSLLFYGSRLNRQRSGDAHTGDMNLKERYFKYHPHQERYTRDHQTGKLVRATINSRGFRGREFDDAKAPHVVRVVTLGASSTFGFHNRDDQTYPAQLEQILNRDAHGTAFEVINLGIPHLESGQILALFEEEALPLHPDIVTFYEGINDSWRSPVLFRRESEPDAPHTVVRQKLRQVSHLRRSFRWARAHFVTIAFADALMKSQRRVTFNEHDVEDHMEGKSENFLQHVSAIYDECRRRGILFIVVSQQAKSRILDREDMRGVTYQDEVQLVVEKLVSTHAITRRELYFLTHNVLMRDLAHWCRDNNVPYVDAIAALDSRRDCLVSWVHLNPEGNRIVAEALARDILTRVTPGVTRMQ